MLEKKVFNVLGDMFAVLCSKQDFPPNKSPFLSKNAKGQFLNDDKQKPEKRAAELRAVHALSEGWVRRSP